MIYLALAHACKLSQLLPTIRLPLLGPQKPAACKKIRIPAASLPSSHPSVHAQHLIRMLMPQSLIKNVLVLLYSSRSQPKPHQKAPVLLYNSRSQPTLHQKIPYACVQFKVTTKAPSRNQPHPSGAHEGAPAHRVVVCVILDHLVRNHHSKKHQEAHLATWHSVWLTILCAHGKPQKVHYNCSCMLTCFMSAMQRACNTPSWASCIQASMFELVVYLGACTMILLSQISEDNFVATYVGARPGGQVCTHKCTHTHTHTGTHTYAG